MSNAQTSRIAGDANGFANKRPRKVDSAGSPNPTQKGRHASEEITDDDADDDDDFGKDVLEDIRRDQQVKEEIRRNGGKKPRAKKDKTSRVDRQTEHTRILAKKGQEKDCKTSKWARREREVNPVVKLMDIQLTLIDSDEDSSDGSVATQDADQLSDVSREIFFQARRRRYRYQNGASTSTKRVPAVSSSSTRRKKGGRNFTFGDTSSDGEDRKPDIRSTPRTPASSSTDHQLRQGYSSATEASERPSPSSLRASKLGKQVQSMMRNEGGTSGTRVNWSGTDDDDGDETDASEDISPLVDREAYQAQLQRRAERKGKGRETTVKIEPKDEPVSDTEAALRAGLAKEDQDSDDESIPDFPMNDPRYIAWLNRRKSGPKASEVKVEEPAEHGNERDVVKHEDGLDSSDKLQLTGLSSEVAAGRGQFNARAQRDAKPFLEIVNPAQAAVGSLWLGKDEHGNDVEVPASINRFLRIYQREGVRFFWKHYAKNEGGLLGDDMGLGKTIQVISFLAAIMGHKCTAAEEGKRRERYLERPPNRSWRPSDFGPTALVIAPASVVENWAREIQTWTYLSAGIIRSSAGRDVLKEYARGFHDIRELFVPSPCLYDPGVRFTKYARELGNDAVICGIDTARKYIDDIASLDFSCIFVDEVHKVKNHRSKTTLAFHQFACRRRFGLTGTAMQNRYAELHTVLDWCFPGRLGDRAQWKDFVETPLKIAQRRDATQEQLATGRERALTLVNLLLPNFFLRRTKELIADQLPRKIDRIVFCPLSEDQKRAYTRLLSHSEIQIILTHDEPCPCGQTDDLGLPYTRENCCNPEWYKPILKWISIFSKVANHAVLIYPNKRDKTQDPLKFAQDQEITRFAFHDSYKGRDEDRYISEIAAIDSTLCGKWGVLKDLLGHWKSKGDKVLLFSRSTRLLDALQYWIELVPYDMVRLDGTVPAEKRLALCDSFNDPNGDKFIFLISTLAGGVGLNLTGANRVVIFDPNWNPVADLQAMDRSYRWGQLRDVTVYRLIGAGSLEELIYSRQIYKQHQAEIAYDAANPSRMFMGVQDDKQRQGELFGVKNLFRYNPSSNRTKMAIEEAQISELGYALMNHASSSAPTACAAKSGKRKRSSSVDSDDEAEGAVSQTEDGLANSEVALETLLKKKVDIKHEEEDDEIAKILKDNGVTYSHQHTNLVKHSKLEARISRAAIQETRNAKSREKATNQRAGNAKAGFKRSAAWAPSKGSAPAPPASSNEVDANEENAGTPSNAFEALFKDGQVRPDILSDLAEALGYPNGAGLAKAFAGMSASEQDKLLRRAKELVESATD